MARQGQTVVEYAILIGVVAASVVGMQVFSQRAIQAVIKHAADELTPHSLALDGLDDPEGEWAQRDGMQHETGNREQALEFIPGDIRVNQTATRTVTDRAVAVAGADDGQVGRVINPGQDTVDVIGALEVCGEEPALCPPGTIQNTEVVVLRR